MVVMLDVIRMQALLARLSHIDYASTVNVSIYIFEDTYFKDLSQSALIDAVTFECDSTSPIG